MVRISNLMEKDLQHPNGQDAQKWNAVHPMFGTTEDGRAGIGKPKMA